MVILDQFDSDLLTILKDVPQGSIFGTLFFNYFLKRCSLFGQNAILV